MLPFNIIATVYSTTPEREPKICFKREKLERANKIQNESLNTSGDTFLKLNLDSVVTSCYLHLCFELEGDIPETR